MGRVLDLGQTTLETKSILKWWESQLLDLAELHIFNL